MKHPEKAPKKGCEILRKRPPKNNIRRRVPQGPEIRKVPGDSNRRNSDKESSPVVGGSPNSRV